MGNCDVTCTLPNLKAFLKEPLIKSQNVGLSSFINKNLFPKHISTFCKPFEVNHVYWLFYRIYKTHDKKGGFVSYKAQNKGEKWVINQKPLNKGHTH